MHIEIEHDGIEYTLTTEHPASHYGMPVLIVNGREYGPADLLPGGDVACDVATTLAEQVLDAVRRYNSQMPPQEGVEQDVPEGWTVYQGRNAGKPEYHDLDSWYFEPDPNTESGEIYSDGYPTRGAAIAACLDWIATQALERGE